MRKSVTIEKRGVTKKEILDWFLVRNSGEKTAGGVKGPGWQVEFVEENQKMLGPMHFPVVILKIEAEQEVFSDLLHRFRVHFLRGGA
ncbi:MAG: hypothetical protein ACP5CD_04920 [Thermovirgaceae bacterium]